MSVDVLRDLAALTLPSSPGDLITGPGQLEWRGLVIGEGTFYCTDQLQGWESLPGVDRSSVTRAGRDGAYPGTVLAQERIVDWSGSIFVDGNATYDARQALIAATYIRGDAVEEPLVIRTDDDLYLAWGQVIARSIPLTTPYRRWVNGVDIQWACSDPRRYLLPGDGSSSLSVTANLPVAGVGFAYPLIYPIDYGALGDNGTRTVINTGSQPTPIMATFWGLLGTPQIVIDNPDGTTSTTTFDVDLAVGEHLDIDALNGTVLLQGTASRGGSASGTPVDQLFLQPGVSQVSLRAESGDAATAHLDVAWNPAYM